MRRDGHAGVESEEMAEHGTAPEAASAPSPPTGGGRSLTELMALPEPQKTLALENAAHSGRTVYLRSKTGKEERRRYGQHVLVVPAKPKPFTAQHAIHLLDVASDRVEECEEE